VNRFRAAPKRDDFVYTLRNLNSCLLSLSLTAGLFVAQLDAQTTLQAPTFGTVINLGYTPSDVVLDESRSQLYLVNSNGSKVDVVNTASNKLVRSILVGTMPLAAAMSPDNSTLYVTNSGVSTVSIIDLGSMAVVQTVSLPAKPQGVAVGGDGRALISTIGSAANSLLILDKSQAAGQQLIPVLSPPSPSTPTQIGSSGVTRPTLAWNSKLTRTPDGNFIIGLTMPSTTSTYLFVYEVASGTILRSRIVTGQSTVLSVAPDGSRFMAGFTLYDIATLGVIGQANNANAPWTIANAFNVQTNVGGSVFSPDGTKIYSAFNNALSGTPTPPPQSSTLFVSDSTNLAIQLGIRLPENILARMVMTADGTKAWSLSQSGLTYLPVSTIFSSPIIQPQTTTVFLTQNPCNPGVVSGTLQILNAGKGKLTFGINTPSTAALTYSMTTGVTPATVTFYMDSGRNGETRQPGTNLITGAGTISGNPIDVTLYSAEAINIPPNIRVYMNYRQSDQRGITYPIIQMPNANTSTPLTGTTGGNEGLWDIVLDQPRNLVYVTNSGYNRIEVFDTVNRVFLNPIPVGQFPHQMALSSDGNTLYVGNIGGESISIVDLTQQAVVGTVAFPAIPRQGGGTTATPSGPRAMAYGLSGLQFLLSSGTAGTGSQWEVLSNSAQVRQPDTVTVTTAGTYVLPGPYQMMMGSADGMTILTIDGTGSGYVYTALGDTYVTKVTGLIPTPITGFYTPLGVASDGSYFTISHYVFNNSLTQLFDAGTARNTVATYPVDSSNYVRLSTPVKAAITTTPADDPRPIIDLINFKTGAIKQLAVSAENPRFTLLGTTRYNFSPRQMVVDSSGVAYVLTISGLTVIPLTYNGAPTPAVATGSKGIVNANDGSQNMKAGTFININGTNLASTATASTVPTPTVLGGSCVTFNDVPLPLLKTSANQIVAQIPTNIISGTNVVVVRSLDTAQYSNPVTITVQAGTATSSGDTGAGDPGTTTSGGTDGGTGDGSGDGSTPQ
jgi:YVTN family beta-propeller protein